MKTRFYIPLANIEVDPELTGAKVESASIQDGKLVLTLEHPSRTYSDDLTMHKQVTETVPAQATEAEKVEAVAVPKRRSSPSKHQDNKL